MSDPLIEHGPWASILSVLLPSPSIVAESSFNDNIISVTSLYGGTVNLFNVHLKNLGIEVSFVEFL